LDKLKKGGKLLFPAAISELNINKNALATGAPPRTQLGSLESHLRRLAGFSERVRKEGEMKGMDVMGPEQV